jgi:hypothetical protein
VSFSGAVVALLLGWLLGTALAVGIILLVVDLVRRWPRLHRMDRPAIVMSSSLGAILMVVGFLLFAVTGPAAAQTYNITWSQADAPNGKADAPFAGNGQKASVSTTVRDGAFSNVTVQMVSCSDTPGAGGSAAAISYELFKDNASIAKGTAPCSQGEVKAVALHKHADAGQAQGDSPAAAEKAAYSAHGYGNATKHTFRLEFSWSRAAGPLPNLPVGGSQFAGRMGIDVQQWKATANLPTEAGK